MSSASQPAVAAPRVPLHNILSFGTLGVPLSAMLVLFGVYLPRHYVSLGIGDFKPGAKTAFLAVAAAITLTRIIDIVFDPLVALAMDWTRTPIGRYRPWLLAGAPLVMLGIYQLLMPTGHVTLVYLIVWLVLTYAGLSMMTLGLAAWSAVLAKTYDDRSRVFAIQQAMGVIGSVAILLPADHHPRQACRRGEGQHADAGAHPDRRLPDRAGHLRGPDARKATGDPQAARLHAGRLLPRARPAFDAAADPGRPGADAGPGHHRAALRLLLPRRQGLHGARRRPAADFLHRGRHPRRAVLGSGFAVASASTARCRSPACATRSPRPS